MASLAWRERGLSGAEEQELVERARSKDVEAAEELLARHERAVFLACRHLLPRDEDVEAAVQETFLRALRGLDRYGGEGSFASWLVAIAVNLCRDRLRRRRLVPFVPLELGAEDRLDPVAVLPAPGPDPERVAMARQAAALMRREVTRLPRRQREAFALRFFVGMDLEGIASVLRVDVGTVKTHLHRAVHRVRAAVAEAMP